MRRNVLKTENSYFKNSSLSATLSFRRENEHETERRLISMLFVIMRTMRA